MSDREETRGRRAGSKEVRRSRKRVGAVRRLAADKMTEMHAAAARGPEDSRFARYREAQLAVYRQMIHLLREPKGTASYALAICMARLRQLENMPESFPLDGEEASQTVLGLYEGFRAAAAALSDLESLLDLERGERALRMEQRSVLDTLLWQETGLTGWVTFDKDGNPREQPTPPRMTAQMLLDGQLP